MEDCLLFLDFDGVLRPVPLSVSTEYVSPPLKHDALPWSDVLSGILEPYPEVKVLISSDRRLSFDNDGLIALLCPLGWRFSGLVENYDDLSRAEEIRLEASRRGLTRRLAVDDHPSMVEAATLELRFIVCDPDGVGVSSLSVQNEIVEKLSLLGLAGDTR